MNEGDSSPLQQKSQIEEETAKTKYDCNSNRKFCEIMLHLIQNDYLCQVIQKISYGETKRDIVIDYHPNNNK